MQDVAPSGLLDEEGGEIVHARLSALCLSVTLLVACSSGTLEVSPSTLELENVPPGPLSFSLAFSSTSSTELLLQLVESSDWQMEPALLPAAATLDVVLTHQAVRTERHEGVLSFEYARAGLQGTEVTVQSLSVPFSVSFACDQDEDGSIAEACGGLDCNDGDPSVYPGAAEECDGLDSDCDGASPSEVDADGDGFLACAECDDGNPQVHPNATDVCDGVDSDCDGDLEDDADGDGFRSCEDCDDVNAWTFPGATETCDGVDSACDGLGDEVDVDVDGYPACADCDDLDLWTHPGADERCGGGDEDCDGETDEGFVFVPGDYPTIAAAVADSSPPICLMETTWEERIVLSGGDPVEVHGQGRDLATLASATLIDPPVQLSAGANLAIAGLTILGSICSNAACDGAIQSASSTLSLTDVRVSGASSEWVSRYLNSSLSFERVEFLDNVGVPIGISGGTASLRGLRLERNYRPLSGEGSGSVVVDSGADVTLSNVLIGAEPGTGGLSLHSSTVSLNRAFIAVGSGLTTAFNVGGGATLDAEGLFLTYTDAPEPFSGAGVFTSGGGEAAVRHVTVTEWSVSTLNAPFLTSGDSPIETSNGLIVGTSGGPVAQTVGQGGPVSFSATAFWDNAEPLVENLPPPSAADGNLFVDPELVQLDGQPTPMLPSRGGPAYQAGEGPPNPDGNPPTLGAFGGPLAASWDLDQDGYPARWEALTPGSLETQAGLDCNDFESTQTPVSGCFDE